MNNKTLYIFYPEYDVSTMLPNSTLLTARDQLLNQSQFHTSVGDLSPADIIFLSKNFDTIELIDVGFDRQSDSWAETKILLNYLSHCCVIKNFTNNGPETFVQSNLTTRIDCQPQLWIFGCSHSHGIGLTSSDQRFGSIVSQNLNLPAVFVTCPGSSLQWSLRHIVNSSINTNDIVIWQITSPNRVTLYNGTVNETMLFQSKNRCLLDTFNDQQIFFHHCSLINHGVKYLRALGIKFVITSLLHQNNLFYRYLNEYTKYPEYCYIPDIYLDLGTDQLHAGPLSHRALAKYIIDHVQYNDDKFI